MNETLKLDQEVYRYVQCSGIHTFKVISINETKYGTQYIVEDQKCNHGWKCQLLIQYCDKDLKFVKMVNDDEDDSQLYWHQNGDKEYYFKTNIQEAYIDIFISNINYRKAAVAKAEAHLKALNKGLEEGYQSLKDAQALIKSMGK